MRIGIEIFPVVVAWAVAGIALRFPDTVLVSWTAWTMVIAGLVAWLGSGLRRPARTRSC